MPITPKTYTRNPFYVDAVKVTADNIHDVAEWCGGEVVSTENGKQHIQCKVRRPLNDRQTKALVGDWVLKAGTGIKVYTDSAFNKNFSSGETVDQIELNI